VVRNTKLGFKTKIWNENLINIYDSEIGDNCNIASFVEISNSIIGDNVKIQAFSFICSAIIEHNVFIGPRVTFTNVKYPRSDSRGKFQGIIVRSGCSIGAGAIILPGVTLGENSVIGAGAVVTKDVDPSITVVGNPAKKMSK
jgi:UDP-2-acetamido-3-amino-2,3-dideoxy-glucuronate N-acetyltransferase